MLIAIMVIIVFMFVIYLQYFSPTKRQKLADEAFIKDLENKVKNKNNDLGNDK
jgi:hypothetical protein